MAPIFLKLYQQRSYVTALENAPFIEGMYLDCAENVLNNPATADLKNPPPGNT